MIRDWLWAAVDLAAAAAVAFASVAWRSIWLGLIACLWAALAYRQGKLAMRSYRCVNSAGNSAIAREETAESRGSRSRGPSC